MTNNLINNETTVHYTVSVNENVIVKRAEFYSGEVGKVEVSQRKEDAYKYKEKETAKKIAFYVGGKVIKHTRTIVVTEVTEEIDIKEENK